MFRAPLSCPFIGFLSLLLAVSLLILIFDFFFIFVQSIDSLTQTWSDDAPED